MTGSQNGTSGQWLRDQRQARGWSVPQMARKLRESGTCAGDILPSPDCLATMIRRWERGSGISERYQLHYCRVFQIQPENFGDPSVLRPGPDEPTAHSAACCREPTRVVLVIVLPACSVPRSGTSPGH